MSRFGGGGIGLVHMIEGALKRPAHRPQRPLAHLALEFDAQHEKELAAEMRHRLRGPRPSGRRFT